MSETDLQRQLEQVLNQEIPLFASGRDIEALRIQTQEKVKQLRFEANLARSLTQAQNGDTAGKNAVSSNIQPERSELISPLANATLTQLNGSRTPYMQLAQANTGSRTDVGGSAERQLTNSNTRRLQQNQAHPFSDENRMKFITPDNNDATGHIPSQRVLKNYRTVQQYADQNGQSPAFILAIIHEESRGLSDARAGSHYGLVQLSPEAAEEGGLILNSDNVDELYDSEINIRTGSNYLSKIETRHGITDQDLILLAHRAGPTLVRSKIRAYARTMNPPFEGSLEYSHQVAAFTATLTAEQKTAMIEYVISETSRVDNANYGAYINKVRRRTQEYQSLIDSEN